MADEIQKVNVATLIKRQGATAANTLVDGLPVTPQNPLPVWIVAGGGDGTGGGGTADAFSAREATQQELLTALQGLSAIAVAQRDLLTALGVNTDGLEALFGPLLTIDKFQERIPLPGQKAKAGSLPVVLASDQGAISVSVGNFPATQPVSGAVSVSNFPATQTVGGTVAVSNLPATQAISGNVGVTSLPKVTAVWAENITVDGTQKALTIPAGATHATVEVLTLPDAGGAETNGSAYHSTSGAAGRLTGLLEPGDYADLEGVEMTAYRITRAGAVNAEVRVRYSKVSA